MPQMVGANLGRLKLPVTDVLYDATRGRECLYIKCVHTAR
jgi:hypothetical protein